MPRLSSLSENLTLKLFSLAVAILLFLFVSIESATPVTADFRIEYRTDEDIVMVGEAPKVLHTTLKGAWASFRSYDINQLPAVVVDLSEAGPGTLRKTIETSDIDPPGGMTVVAISPSPIEVTLDRKVERQVTVLPDTKADPPSGYIMVSALANPPRARVVGPASLIATLELVQTMPIALEGHRVDFEVEVDLKQPPPPLKLKDRKVTVLVQISDEMTTRAFDVAVTTGEEQGVRVLPESVPVKLLGPRSIVDALDPATLEAYVDLQPELDEGQATFDKSVTLRGNPERTQWVGSQPRVQVQVSKGRLKKPKRK